MKLQLDLSEQAADLLRTNSMRAFHHEQDGRFIELDGGNLADPAWNGGTMHWCDSGADALLLRAFEEAAGHRAILLSDEAAGELEPWVVLSSRPWDEWVKHLPKGDPKELHGAPFYADAVETSPPYPEPLHTATRLWHDVMAALDHTGVRAQHVQIYPGRPRGDGDGFRDPELNVYLRSEDPEDLRRFASHLGIDAEMTEHEEVKEERAGLARITYWSIEEKDDDRFTYRRVWASRRVIEPKGGGAL